ncbi:Ribosomal protein S18 acetylase RimI [Micromonospora phaseoli]|uniref:Ribosomal protein S18 acetylase RimI n=1 Tax=Micromonospora phaseoli TaxID=1144548 RepID=A0A1H7DYM5_9ACTN|nr:GNAT family N-acetyltransferase [Micromonospora phaseoli]PZV88972.1 ribosomal protein S18 acetylase RimI-like enzyme [Micromonospora phaseoli]GIJ80966.1 N-acetyltransferase [Micromonospora phaseoli]SEK06514.1 Ribosomal protein S18 acetylase RimI [Micromonospora phaseoli]
MSGLVTDNRLLIRSAEPADTEVLHRFIVELTEAEEFPGTVTAQPADVANALFGARPVAEAVVAAVADEPVGFALYYPTYSTVLGRPGIHLEDLYVRPEHRGDGIGRALLAHLARLALARGCGRLEWWVLRTNDPALRFYRRLHARTVDEIDVLRIDGERLRALATETDRSEVDHGVAQ